MSPAPIEALLGALARRQPVDVPMAVVVAHPDDETVGAGASLSLFRNLTLVHVTDGAPRNLRDARAAGFATRRAYAVARRRELRSALRIGGVPQSALRRQVAGPLRLPVADQSVAQVLVPLARTMREMLSGVTAVITHAYEGGHPDHDAVAFAVQLAGLPTIEMAGYHATPAGEIEVGCFASVGNSIVIPLSEAERARRDAMLECFATQRMALAPFFSLQEERFRAAPRYDFTRPAAPCIYYDRFDWGLTSDRWCELAAQAMTC